MINPYKAKKSIDIIRRVQFTWAYVIQENEAETTKVRPARVIHRGTPNNDRKEYGAPERPEG